jgi:glycogen operon protein
MILEHKSSKKISSGRFYPLGATVEEDGINFAVFSQYSWKAFLILFDKPDGEPTDIISMKDKTRNIWHVKVHGIKAGQLYGFKMVGDYNPAWGLRFNPDKFLIDPYSKALTGKPVNRDNLLLGYDPSSPAKDLSIDSRDSTPVMPRSIVIDDSQFDWQSDKRLDIPLEKLIIYEVHLKGFTADPSSGVSNRGTYLGFIEKIPYLKSLGINAVELLPIHEFYIDDFLLNKNLTNYWGYNTIGFFAPESSYSTGRYPGCQVEEFKMLVRELHKAGIEVILDVVYNHTGEGNEMGPTISFKGIDNPTYYALAGDYAYPRRYYKNYTGCGNSVNLENTFVIQYVMDSLRYWAEVMHVDGFRFDLASVLGREYDYFKRSAAFFDAVAQDPVLNHIKLIAEPWDLGTYEVGNFPIDWSEWNGKFRDSFRRFGKGDTGIGEIGWRITGSADLFGDDGRTAYNSINFITCHDGFTLYDLVSYNGKHNEANLENNNDGANDNHSWNCGWEGDTGNPDILNLRKQMVKNYLSYLLLSRGTPMILGGDEFMRTQKGNNNAYCQDNPVSWYNWKEVEKNKAMVQFVSQLIQVTKNYPVLMQKKYLLSRDLDGNRIPDIQWWSNNGEFPNWNDPGLHHIAFILDGEEVPGEQNHYRLLIIFNAHWENQYIRIPPVVGKRQWKRVMDTSLGDGKEISAKGKEVLIKAGEFYITNARSTVILVEE